MTNPTLITTPFAENGDKNIIPESVGAEPQNATMQAGFPPITQQKISEGGIPPERNDFNGILNLYGQHIVHLNKGLPYEFDQAFANAIGGYPLNARLMLDNGDIVQSTISNNVNNPNSDMSGWKRDGSYSYTVDDFGAKGDGVTDDSAAFQAYIDSPSTPKNVYLGQRRAVYCIKKTVDFKGRGLVGNGFGAQSEADYSLSSIKVPADFVGADVFINVKSTIKNLNLVQEVSTDLVNGINFDPYNISIDNVNIKGFGLQAYAKVACVAMRITNFTSIEAKKFAIQIQDKVTAQSTTAYFRNCSFQWGEGAIDFADNGQCYGSNFENIIIEYMRTGITGGLFSKCSFDNIWAEQTIDHVSRPWLQNSTPQQMIDNTIGIVKLQGDWTNPYLPVGLAPANNSGGVIIDDSLIGIQNSTGNGIVFNVNGIKTRHNNYAENRDLVIQTQPIANESGYRTALRINSQTGEFYLGNISETDYTPFVKKRVVGKTKDSIAPYYAYDELSPLGYVLEAYNPSTGTSGKFQAPMFITWDSGRENPNVAGWLLSKISTGVFSLTRTAGNNIELLNPNLLISGIFSSQSIVSRVQAIEAYAGSWVDYRAASGFTISFSNLSGVLTDPDRFTIAFTMR